MDPKASYFRAFSTKNKACTYPEPNDKKHESTFPARKRQVLPGKRRQRTLPAHHTPHKNINNYLINNDFLCWHGLCIFEGNNSRATDAEHYKNERGHDQKRQRRWKQPHTLRFRAKARCAVK
jgi:hypothetical protein